MNRGALSWMMGGAGFLLAAVLFVLLALSRGGGPAAPAAAPRAALPESSPMANRLPVPEELGIVLPAEPEQPELALPERRPQPPERQEQPADPAQEDTVRELERKGILTY